MYSVAVSLPPDTCSSRSENGITTPDLTVLSGGTKCARTSDLLPDGPSGEGEQAETTRSRTGISAAIRTG